MMNDITYRNANQSVQRQVITTYHFQTALTLALTQTHLRYLYPEKQYINDLNSIDITNEQQRRSTFHQNWDETIYNVQSFAQNGFFSLTQHNDMIQCFSCGLLITRFPHDIPIFTIHLLLNPNCRHIANHDQTNQITSKHVITRANTHSNNVLQYDIRQSTCMFCLGQTNTPIQEDHWQEHTKDYPYCPLVLKIKGQTYIKQILSQTNHTLKITRYAS